MDAVLLTDIMTIDLFEGANTKMVILNRAVDIVIHRLKNQVYITLL
jgi:hypothetical protein